MCCHGNRTTNSHTGAELREVLPMNRSLHLRDPMSTVEGFRQVNEVPPCCLVAWHCWGAQDAALNTSFHYMFVPCHFGCFGKCPLPHRRSSMWEPRPIFSLGRSRSPPEESGMVSLPPPSVHANSNHQHCQLGRQRKRVLFHLKAKISRVLVLTWGCQTGDINIPGPTPF